MNTPEYYHEMSEHHLREAEIKQSYDPNGAAWERELAKDYEDMAKEGEK